MAGIQGKETCFSLYIHFTVEFFFTVEFLYHIHVLPIQEKVKIVINFGRTISKMLNFFPFRENKAIIYLKRAIKWQYNTISETLSHFL